MSTKSGGADEIPVCRNSAAARMAVGKLVMFFCLTVVTFMITDNLADRGLRAIKTSSFGVYNRMINGEINAQIIISGSSRALNNFDPRIIQAATGMTTFDIGVDGSQTDMQLAVLKTYLRHNARPLLLIQSLDSFAFVMSHGGVDNPGQYLPYLNEDAIYEALNAIDANTWKARYLPLYGYAVDMNFTWLTGVRGLLGWNPKEDHYLGFAPRYAHWTGDFNRFRADKPAGVRFEVEPEGLRVFDELMNVSKNLGIRVLLVYSPVYYEMQGLENNREDIFRRFKEITQRYDVPLWDYSRSPISFSKDYFVNSQHLNADGAAAFSADLATALHRHVVALGLK